MAKPLYLPDPNAPLWKIEVSSTFPPKVHVFHNGHKVCGLQRFKLEVDNAGALKVKLKYASVSKNKREVKHHG